MGRPKNSVRIVKGLERLIIKAVKESEESNNVGVDRLVAIARLCGIYSKLKQQNNSGGATVGRSRDAASSLEELWRHGDPHYSEEIAKM